LPSLDASGDSGSSTGNFDPPDDNPYLTQVGGTTLATTGPGGTWLSEVSWNTGYGPYAGQRGGGVSSTYPIPAWQKGVKMTTNKGSTTYRAGALPVRQEKCKKTAISLPGNES
jgi:kumamolisin